MAESTIQKEIKIVLILDEAEAKFIRDLVQNPYMYDGDIDEEPTIQSLMREEIFNAVDKALND